MPSSRKARKEIMSLISDNNKQIFELGSGFGTLALSLAKKFPQSQITAFEISWVPYFFSLILKKLYRVKNLTINRKNFYTISLKEADCVVCYLCPKAMERLKNKFTRELKSSACIITNTFAIPGWKPLQIKQGSDILRTQIFLYIKFY